MSMVSSVAHITRHAAGSAMIAAADWLEANPDRHIRGTLATTATGWEVGANDPEANCFCAIGRIGHELDLYAAYDIRKAINQHFENPVSGRIIVLNDSVPSTLRGESYDGKALAISLMRKKGQELLA